MAEVRASGGGSLRRFVLERHPVRVIWTRLDDAWRELRRYQHYTPAVEALLGEAATAAVLLAATLKFEGTLSLQLQGQGLVKLLVAQCTHDFQIRAVARVDGAVEQQAGFRELVGDGQLAVTIEADERAARYQGIVALQGDTLAACLENYFATSEQLPTRIALAADGASAAGVLLQRMPLANAHGEELAAVSQQAWDDLQRNLATLSTALLQRGAAEEVLQHLRGEHEGRLFADTPVQFVCRCSPQRVAGLLRGLGSAEVHSLLAEQGAVTVTCEFCSRPYRFDAIDVERLFAAGAHPEAPESVN